MSTASTKTVSEKRADAGEPYGPTARRKATADAYPGDLQPPRARIPRPPQPRQGRRSGHRGRSRSRQVRSLPSQRPRSRERRSRMVMVARPRGGVSLGPARLEEEGASCSQVKPMPPWMDRLGPRSDRAVGLREAAASAKPGRVSGHRVRCSTPWSKPTRQAGHISQPCAGWPGTSRSDSRTACGPSRTRQRSRQAGRRQSLLSREAAMAPVEHEAQRLYAAPSSPRQADARDPDAVEDELGLTAESVIDGAVGREPGCRRRARDETPSSPREPGVRTATGQARQ